MYSRACIVLLAFAFALTAEEPKPKPTDRAVTFAKNGQVDLLVAALAASDYKADDDRLWAPALALGAKALECSEMRGDRKPLGPALFENAGDYRKNYRPDYARSNERYTRAKEDANGQFICSYQIAVLAPSVQGEHSLTGLFVSPGSVSAKTGIRDSLILTNGSLETAGPLGSVIICDGDVRLKGATRSLIIARGDIKIDKASGCSFVAGGKVSLGEIPPMPVLKGDPNDPEVRVRWGAYLAEFEPVRVWYEEKNANPLKFITFFELHRVGIEAKVEGGALVLSAVKGDSVAGRAGLKAGDVVLSAGSAKPSDPEALRRALRDALAVGEAKVQVRRAGATVEAKFALPE
jgi:hypothetical protein